jgi:hypothetical protein
MVGAGRATGGSTEGASAAAKATSKKRCQQFARSTKALFRIVKFLVTGRGFAVRAEEHGLACTKFRTFALALSLTELELLRLCGKSCKSDSSDMAAMETEEAAVRRVP